MKKLIVKQKISSREMTALALSLVSVAFLTFSIVYMDQDAHGSQKVQMASTADTYYVDCGASTGGNGSYNSPFNKLSDTHWIGLGSGDRVLIKKGSVCRGEKLYIHESGSSDLPIVFSSYPEDSGDAIPVIDGQGILDFAIQLDKVNNIEIKDLKIINVASANFSNTASAIFSYLSNNIEINNVFIENSYGSAGIYVLYNDNQNNFVIKNSVIKNLSSTINHPYTTGGGAGIVIHPNDDNVSGSNKSTNGVIIDNVDISNCQNTGIGLYNIKNSIIFNNTIDNNGGAGIHIGGKLASNNIIEKNIVGENAQNIDDVAGIDLLQVGDNNIVRYNLVYSQYRDMNSNSTIPNPGNPLSEKYGSSGIRFDGGVPNETVWNASGNKAYYNKIYNEHYGLTILNFNNIELYNNTVVSSEYSGIHLMAYNDALINFGGTKIKNNIISVAPRMIDYYARENSSMGGDKLSLDNNIYYNGSDNINFVSMVVDFGTSLETQAFSTFDFSEWKNSNSEISDNVWQRFYDGSTATNVWFIAKNKVPISLYFGSTRGVRAVSADQLGDLKKSGCSNKWGYIEAGGTWYLAVCSASKPTNIKAYNSETMTGVDDNSVVSDPKFVNTSSNNFEILEDSPAKDKGLFLSGINTQDYEGRSMVGVPDIGALEYQGVACQSKTCAQLGKECGSFDDGCGNSLNCGADTKACATTFGTCSSSGIQTCQNGSYSSCVATDPRISNCSNKECGSDDCGGTCGVCSTSEQCINNKCETVCTPATCSSLSKSCGSYSDNCGGSITCGTCRSGYKCSSGTCVRTNSK